MLFKWFIGGAIFGVILSFFGGDSGNPLGFALVGGFFAVALRKWIFIKFWG